MLYPPIVVHGTRWMAKVIYSIKRFLFRKEFKLTKQCENNLRQVCMIIVTIYIYMWFQVNTV